MKNKFLISLLLLGAASGSLLTSCKDDKETFQAYQDPCFIGLSQNEVNVVLGDTFKLNAEISGGDGSATLSLTSTDNEIASVDEHGLITTHKPGSCTIKGIYGNAYATCKVNVVYGDNAAFIELKSVSESEITIDLKTNLDFSPYIKFNNKEFEFEPTYTVGDSEVGTFVNGKFVPKKVGSTIVTISGTLFGRQAVSKTILVNVKNDVIIFMKEQGGHEYNQVTLFSVEYYKGIQSRTSFAAEFGVYFNGEFVDSPNIQVTLDDPDSIVSYEEATKTVSSISKEGSAKFNVKYTDLQSNVYYQNFNIYCNKSVFEYESELIETDSVSGDLPLSDIFTDFNDKNVRRATSEDGSVEFEVESNKIKGIPVAYDEYDNLTNKTIVVYNDTVGFKVNVIVYDKIIKVASDLDYFNLKDSATVFDGHYFVANDIDCAGYAVKKQYRFNGSGYNDFPSSGLCGEFDGRGHTISNFSVAEDGLFGNIGKGAVIKNLRIKDVDFRINEGDSNDDTTLLAGYINGAKFENVCITNDIINGKNNASLLSAAFTSTTQFKNCYFELEQDTNVNPIACNNFGVLCCLYSEFNNLSTFGGFTDTYVVSKTPAVCSKGYSVGKHIVDAANFEFELEGYARYNFPNLKHYKTSEDMVNDGNDYSSFSSNYWKINNGMLEWYQD